MERISVPAVWEQFLACMLIAVMHGQDMLTTGQCSCTVVLTGVQLWAAVLLWLERCHAAHMAAPQAAQLPQERYLCRQQLLFCFAGPTNATLIGVLDGPKAAALLQSGGKLYQGLDAAKLQQQLVLAMQVLFGQVVVTKPSNTSSSSSSSTGGAGSTKQTAAGAAAQSKQAGNTTAAAAGNDAEASGENPKVRRHPPRQRQRQHRPQQEQQQSSSASTPGSQQHTEHGKWRHRGPHGTMPGPAATDAGNSSSANAPVNSTETATSAAGSESAAADSSVAGTSGAAQSSQPPGRRVLQKELPAAAASTAVNAAAAGAAGNATEAAADADPAPLSEAEVEDADDEAAAATAAGSTAKGAVLYRQDCSIILRPSSSCEYQFMVTRNPSFLQPDPQLAAEPGVRGPRKRSKSSSWWVSAGALFAGVSAVLALAVCYMSSSIWSRYKVRLWVPAVRDSKHGLGHFIGQPVMVCRSGPGYARQTCSC